MCNAASYIFKTISIRKDYKENKNLPLQLHRTHWTDTQGRFGRIVLKHLKER